MGKIKLNDKTKQAILTVLLLLAIAVVSLVLTIGMNAKAKTARADERGGRAASVQGMAENNLPDWIPSVLPPAELEYSPDNFYTYALGLSEGDMTMFKIAYSDAFLHSTDIFVRPYDKDGVFLMQGKSTTGKINGEAFELDIALDFSAGGYLVIYFVDTGVSNAYTVVEITEDLSIGEYMPPNSFYDLYKEGKANSVTSGITEDELNVAIEAARAEGYAAGLEEASAEEFLLDFKLFKLDADTSFIVIVSFLGVSAAIVVLLALAGLGIVVKKLRK